MSDELIKRQPPAPDPHCQWCGGKSHPGQSCAEYAGSNVSLSRPQVSMDVIDKIPKPEGLVANPIPLNCAAPLSKMACAFSRASTVIAVLADQGYSTIDPDSLRRHIGEFFPQSSQAERDQILDLIQAAAERNS